MKSTSPQVLNTIEPTADALWPESQVLDPHFAENVPNLQVFRLQNGLRVLIMSDHADRSTYMQMMVNGGAIHQPTKPRGVAHFMEHYLFNGTEKFAKGFPDIAEFTKEYNLDFNGFVGSTEEGYYVEADNDEESINAAATFLAEIIFHPTFPAEKLEKEKGVITSERKGNMSKPNRVCSEVILNHYFDTEHPLSGGGITGTETDIAEVTHPMLLEFYRQHFNPQNLILVIVGGLSVQRYLDLADQYFGNVHPDVTSHSWRHNPLAGRPRATPVHDTAEAKDFKHISYYASYYIPRSRMQRFSREFYALQVAEGALATRMFLDIRDRQGLAYHTSANSFDLYDGYAFFAFAEFDPGKFNVIKPQIDEYVARVFDEPITATELKRELRALRSVRWANNARDIALDVAEKYFEYGQLISPEGLHHLHVDLTVAEVNDTYRRLLSDIERETIAVGAIS